MYVTDTEPPTKALFFQKCLQDFSNELNYKNVKFKQSVRIIDVGSWKSSQANCGTPMRSLVNWFKFDLKHDLDSMSLFSFSAGNLIKRYTLKISFIRFPKLYDCRYDMYSDDTSNAGLLGKIYKI